MVKYMSQVFPKPILNLPKADIPLRGINAYISQGNNHQIIFMEFTKDVYIPEHSHESQWEIVLNGKVELFRNNTKDIFKKGNSFYIPKGMLHSAKVTKGYSSIVFFNQVDRYKKK